MTSAVTFANSSDGIYLRGKGFPRGYDSNIANMRTGISCDLRVMHTYAKMSTAVLELCPIQTSLLTCGHRWRSGGIPQTIITLAKKLEFTGRTLQKGVFFCYRPLTLA